MTDILAHPILTGSIYPVRSNTRTPVISDGSAEYRLIPEEGCPPSGLLARLFSMIAFNKMLARGDTATSWDNIHQIFADMGTKESGANLAILKKNLIAFNRTTISTPYGPLHLRIENLGGCLLVTADEDLVGLIHEQGVKLSLDAVHKLRGKGIGGVPIDLYAWAVSISQRGAAKGVIPWSEIACRTALSNNANLPLYFGKSMDLVNQVCQVISAKTTKEGLVIDN